MEDIEKDLQEPRQEVWKKDWTAEKFAHAKPRDWFEGIGMIMSLSQADFVREFGEKLLTLNTENERLREALQELYDWQNGPPLIRKAKQWQAAMDKAEKLLPDWPVNQ